MQIRKPIHRGDIAHKMEHLLLCFEDVWLRHVGEHVPPNRPQLLLVALAGRASIEKAG